MTIIGLSVCILSVSVQIRVWQPRSLETPSPPQAAKTPALKAPVAAVAPQIVRPAGTVNGGWSRGNGYGQAEPLLPGGNDLVLVPRSSLPQYSAPSNGFYPAADAKLFVEAGPASKRT